jgi:outer membrane protein OmpA-like peptidoglycan-associated protein
MDKYNYSGAIEVLKKATDNPKRHDAAIVMLAECYKAQHDVAKTRDAYAQVIKLPGVAPEHYLNYAQALQSSGDYTKAREMFLKYAEACPTDPAGKLFASHCDSVTGPWSHLKPAFEAHSLSKINTPDSDFGPVILGNDLIFASDHTATPVGKALYKWTGRGYLDLMKATPATQGDFGGNYNNASNFSPILNQLYHDGPVCFSSDGNSLFLTRSYFGKAKREGIYKTNKLKLFTSQKVDGIWQKPEPFFLNSNDYSVGHAALTPDSKTLYFVSDMPGGKGGTDIWMCKNLNGMWSDATNLGAVINTSQNEMFPVVASDGNLYFSSNGHAGYGSLDIFKSVNNDSQWSVPQNMHMPFNSSFDDFAIAFVPGTSNGLFSSNRTGGQGSDDIYAFTEIVKPQEVIQPAYLTGIVKDKSNQLPVGGATVFVLNHETGMVKVLKTKADGSFSMKVENPAAYSIKATMSNYIADCLNMKMASVKAGTTSETPRELLLDKLEVNKVFRIENIYYNFDKYDIRDDAKPELDKLVRIMKENPITVELGSHTDCRGSFAYNDKLSQNRAESAVGYIVKSGVEKTRITAKGYGEHQLTNKCADGIICSPAEHQANRRTEFKVTGTPASTPANLFNPDNFKDGDEVKPESLPAEFFKPCN